jgi:hypothetical protein
VEILRLTKKIEPYYQVVSSKIFMKAKTRNLLLLFCHAANLMIMEADYRKEEKIKRQSRK